MQSAPGFPVPHLPSLSWEPPPFRARFANPRAARPGGGGVATGMGRARRGTEGGSEMAMRWV